MKLYERLPDRITVDGKKYKLDLDFRNVLYMLDILDRNDLLPAAREYLALKCIMKRPPVDGLRVMIAVKHLLFGESKGGDGKRVTSFEQDADLIRAAFMQEYGINLYTEKLHWLAFIALLHGLPQGNRYTDVIGIRSRPIPAANKWNKAEREAMIKAQAAYALRYTEEQAEQNYSNSVRRVFADMKTIADRK